jgi:hypothetical protein
MTGPIRLHPSLPEPIKLICELAQEVGVEQARVLYEQVFGVYPFKAEAKPIREEVARRLALALASGDDTVVLPLATALGLYLDEGGGGRRSGALKQQANKRVIFNIYLRSNELRADGLRPGAADEQAVKEELPPDKWDWAHEELRHLRRKRKSRKI